MNKAEKETLLRRTAPSRQKQAQEYLQGRSPGTMQRYAPDAHADPEQGWVESEETVKVAGGGDLLRAASPPLGGSCQWPRPLTDEGQVRQYSPFAEWPHGRGRACPARGLPTDAILPFC